MLIIKVKNLDDIELGNFLRQRKRIYEELHPETKQGGDRKSDDFKTNSVRLETFTKDTEKAIGLKQRSVQEKIQASELVERERKKRGGLRKRIIP